jgi:very-short-patch-repair endonuclease
MNGAKPRKHLRLPSGEAGAERLMRGVCEANDGPQVHSQENARIEEACNMHHLSNGNLTGNAQALRRNMTREERKLWYRFLKHLPITVNRQKVIGNYIVDFYIDAFRLVIELDGDQHGEPANLAKDQLRDTWLRDQGLTVLRYPNSAVNSGLEGVCRDILDHLPGIRAPVIE